jgi:hypothetical protein
MQLTIGSSRLRNTDGIISVRGDEQIVFEWGQLDSRLLLTMDLYNVSGNHIARLRRNQWTFNDRDRFAFTTSATSVSIVDTSSSEVVLEARVVDDDSVAVTRGVFNNSAGRQIEVTAEDWSVTADTQVHTTPTIESAEPTFSEHEIVSIRTAVTSSQDTVECPRCAAPLTRARLPHATQHDAWLVSCIMCRRNVVVRGQS